MDLEEIRELPALYDRYTSFLIGKNLAYYDAERKEIVALAYLPPHPRFFYNWLKVKHEILCQPDNVIHKFWEFVKKISAKGGLLKPEQVEEYKMMYKEVRLKLAPYLAWIERCPAAEPGTVLHDGLFQGLWDNPKVEFKNFP